MDSSDDENFYDAEDVFDELGSTEGEEPTTTAAPPGEAPAPAAGPAPAATAGGGAATSDVGSAAISAPFDEPREPFALHRAAWHGQVDLVKRLVAGMSREQLKAFDSQGNTALHVAVMRRQADVVSALLGAGCSAGSRNARGWGPLMEAVDLGERALALQLAEAEVAQMRTAVKSKKASLLALLRSELPDFSLQLKWELGSAVPGVGALVRRYAPHDTYTLWKKGGLIRVDGSLMGVDADAASVVPTWKRGHFSLLYDATGDKARALLVNHTDKTYLDVKAARKQLGMAEGAESRALETEVDVLLASEVLQHKKLRSVDFRFKPVAGWLTKEVREKVEGWNCKLYEAAGRLVAASHYKMPYGLTPDMSYDDYLAARFEPDPVVESPVNPMNPASFKDRGTNPAKAAAKLAVAAKHQRIAAAAAEAKDEAAARLAKAAAARAAAGGLRALAPRIDEGAEDDEDGEGAEADEGGGGGGGGKERVSGAAARKAAGDGGGGGGRGRAAPVVTAIAEPVLQEGQEQREQREQREEEDLAGVDLTALAARVAAEAAEAQRAKKERGEGEDDDDDDDDDGEGADDDTSSFEASTRGGDGSGDADLEVDSKARVAAAAAAAAGPSSAVAATAGGAKGAAGAAGAVSSGNGCSRGTSRKGWRSWGFGKKTAEPGGGGGGGGDGGGAAAAGDAAGGGGGAAAAAKKSRKISGRCWMAESFPLSLKQLLPLLEVVGTANKAFAKVARFMQKYGDLAMFPVKVQVPLILTVYMLLSFKQFRLLQGGTGRAAPPPDDFFRVPPGYTEDKLDKMPPERTTPPTAEEGKEEEGKEEGGMESTGLADGSSQQGGAGEAGMAAVREPSSSSKGPAAAAGGGGGGRRRNLTLLQRDVMDDEMGLGGGGLAALDD